MRVYPFVELSVSFAVEILNLVKYLKSQHETIICNQIGRAYSETLPLKDAKKWKNKKLSPGLLQTRKRSLQINHKYTVISSKDAAGKKIIVVEENIKTNKSYYKFTLEKIATGWIVVKTEDAKK